jgi:hypothetical protein
MHATWTTRERKHTAGCHAGVTLIPMKERVVGRKYDPLVWLGAKIGRRPRHDTPAVPGLSHGMPVMPGPKAPEVPGGKGLPGRCPSPTVQSVAWVLRAGPDPRSDSARARTRLRERAS